MELRLAGINDQDSTNEFLYRGFLEELNEKFAVAAREEEDYHCSAQCYDLASIFCIEEERSISPDWIVRFESNFYQLKRQSNYEPARGKVSVRKYLNGELHLNYRGEDMAYERLAERPERISKSLKPKVSKRSYRPAPNHP